MIRIFDRIGLVIGLYMLAAGIGMAMADTAPAEPQPPAELLQKAEKGDAAAQRDLGLFYRQQRSDDIDTAKRNNENANKWLKQAAEQGDAVAQYKYATGFCGWYYALNRAEECIAWLGKAAAQGVAGAQRELGLIYLRGGYKNGSKEKAVEKDPDKAMKLLTKAAAQNDPEAMYLLATAYSQFKKDMKSAVEWYLKAAEMMNTHAMTVMADMYLRGTPHVQKNTPKGLALYHEAAELFNIEAQFELAHLYLKGEIMPKDYKKATELFRQIDENTEAVDYDNNTPLVDYIVDAKLHLGIMYRDGLGVDRDDKEALHYFHQAEHFDSQDAQYLIAQAYEEGRGVPKDLVAAYIWYTRAKDEFFRPFWFDFIDLVYDEGDPRHMVTEGAVKKALEALEAKMHAKDLERAKRHAAAERHTRMQLDGAHMWQQIP